MTIEPRHLCGLVGLALVGWVLADTPGLHGLPHGEDDAAPRVSSKMQDDVQPVADALRGVDAATRADLAALWLASSRCVAWNDERNPIRSTAHIREFERTAGPLYFQGEHVGGEKLLQALESVTAKVLGKDPVKLDDNLRERAAELLAAFSQAAGGS